MNTGGSMSERDAADVLVIGSGAADADVTKELAGSCMKSGSNADKSQHSTR